MKKKILDVKTEATLYPYGYFDFTGGIQLLESEKQTFIRECIENGIREIKENKLKKTFNTMATGDTIVFVAIYKQKNDLFTIDISVCNSYQNKMFIDVHF